MLVMRRCAFLQRFISADVACPCASYAAYMLRRRYTHIFAQREGVLPRAVSRRRLLFSAALRTRGWRASRLTRHSEPASRFDAARYAFCLYGARR